MFISTIEKIDEAGKKTAQDFKENMKMEINDFLPQWSRPTISEQPRWQIEELLG